jgi:uncharacterized membrane protein
MLRFIAKHELVHAQVAILMAVALQSIVWQMNDQLLVGVQYLLIPTEIILAILISFTVSLRTLRRRSVNHSAALTLLALISGVNVVSLFIVMYQLIVAHAAITGLQLLASAIAIFMTNIIVFALWYWEIDSPGLSGHHWRRSDQVFYFTQQGMKLRFPGWRPEFFDYAYLSVTNAINFAPADSKPLTHTAKILMALQALVSVFTLALVIARSVSILGT